MIQNRFCIFTEVLKELMTHPSHIIKVTEIPNSKSRPLKSTMNAESQTELGVSRKHSNVTQNKSKNGERTQENCQLIQENKKDKDNKPIIHKLTIIRDSHACDIAKLLMSKLEDVVLIYSTIKPIAKIEGIVMEPNLYKETNNGKCIIIFAGANA